MRECFLIQTLLEAGTGWGTAESPTADWSGIMAIEGCISGVLELSSMGLLSGANGVNISLGILDWEYKRDVKLVTGPCFSTFSTFHNIHLENTSRREVSFFRSRKPLNSNDIFQVIRAIAEV
jgi:hypothetical protein